MAMVAPESNSLLIEVAHVAKDQAVKSSPLVRILIVDDHELIRQGVRFIFSRDPQFVICGEAANGAEAIEQVKKLSPHAVVLDISMPVMNGLEAATEIRRLAPKTKIVVLTMHDSAQMRHQSQEAGADAFITKSQVASKLLQVVQSLLEIRKAETS
jgi:DNA-binding NarL/FixJ family response regulator